MYVHIQEIEFTVKHLKEKSGPNWALVVSSIKHLSNKTNSIETLPDNRKFLDSCMRPVLLWPKWNKKIVGRDNYCTYQYSAKHQCKNLKILSIWIQQYIKIKRVLPQKFILTFKNLSRNLHINSLKGETIWTSITAIIKLTEN